MVLPATTIHLFLVGQFKIKEIARGICAALESQNETVLFNLARSLIEHTAALAYQLERKWAKDKILTQYLNSVYFGQGAYGIESAARVYFGWNHPDCVPHCAAVLDPAEAAMLAGLIASPSAYNPVFNPPAALNRRNLVLARMRDEQYITDGEYVDFSPTHEFQVVLDHLTGTTA